MQGNVESRGKRSWRITVDLGTDAQGKRLRHRETVHGFKRDAERRLREVIRSVEVTHDYVPPSSTTVGQYLEQWVCNYALTHTAPRTAESYRAELRRHIIPALGTIPLTRLSPQDLETYYAAALTTGRKDGRGGLSARTVLYHHRILSEALEHAVRTNQMARNPAKLADPPHPRRPEVSTLAAEDVPKFLDAASESAHFPLYVTALYTGMRMGELLGLRWRNVDLEGGRIIVVEALQRDGARWSLAEPKSARGRRQVVLPRRLVDCLSEHKAGLEAERAALRTTLGTDDFVFCTVNGAPLDRHTVSRGFSRILEKAELPHIRFHDLRHTHASLLLRAGTNPKVVSERLGHATVAFTLDTYSHVMPTLQEEAAARFDKLLGGGA